MINNNSHRNFLWLPMLTSCDERVLNGRRSDTTEPSFSRIQSLIDGVCQMTEYS